MKFSEITVFTNSESAELVAYFLQEVCMDGVSIYDRTDLLLNSSWDYKDDSAEMVYDTEVQVKGYCEEENTASVLDFLRQNFANLTNAGSLTISVCQVEGDAWVETWKKTFQPIETDKLVICPEWQSCDANGKKVLLLDTGIAFGTGQHATTSMCIAFLEQMDLVGKRVLDVGCGSGILGLSALLLGAASAELVDIDSQATAIALHNAQINNCDDRCQIKTGNLTEQTEGRFDVVFANLTADILALLFQDIAKVVSAKTQLVLSGILDVKLAEVVARYSQKFDVVEQKQQGEWCTLLLVARAE